MIKFEHTEVLGWEHAIRGMRNPKNSWDRMDSFFGCTGVKCDECDAGQWEPCGGEFIIGPNDQDLMKKLAKGGPVHAKYRRMIAVYVDITAPLYWWKEFDTYKVGTVANSCSTMHKIHEKEFMLEDFSHEHLFVDGQNVYCPDAPLTEDDLFVNSTELMKLTITLLNQYRQDFLDTKDKRYWWQMIQLLPTSYNQKRTIMLNYEVLAGIYKWRKNHKLDEWCEFCRWIETLPYSEIITGEKTKEEE